MALGSGGWGTTSPRSSGKFLSADTDTDDGSHSAEYLLYCTVLLYKIDNDSHLNNGQRQEKTEQTFSLSLRLGIGMVRELDCGPVRWAEGGWEAVPRNAILQYKHETEGERTLGRRA